MITRILTSEWRLSGDERLLASVDAAALRVSGRGYSMSVSGSDT